MSHIHKAKFINLDGCLWLSESCALVQLASHPTGVNNDHREREGPSG